MISDLATASRFLLGPFDETCVGTESSDGGGAPMTPEQFSAVMATLISMHKAMAAAAKPGTVADQQQTNRVCFQIQVFISCNATKFS